GALGLAEPGRALFMLAARGKAPAAEVMAARQGKAPGAFAAAATRSLPRTLPPSPAGRPSSPSCWGLGRGGRNGRVVGICAIDGMARIGKTAFAVPAAHRLSGMFADGQFFLPLRAHTAGQRPSARPTKSRDDHTS